MKPFASLSLTSQVNNESKKLSTHVAVSSNIFLILVPMLLTLNFFTLKWKNKFLEAETLSVISIQIPNFY